MSKPSGQYVSQFSKANAKEVYLVTRSRDRRLFASWKTMQIENQSNNKALGYFIFKGEAEKRHFR